MSLSARLTESFAQVSDQFHKEELVLPVDIRAIRRALEPVNELMQLDPTYSGLEIGVDYQLKFLRQTCLELQLAKTGQDETVLDDQKQLLESLQNIMEDVTHAQNGVAQVGADDLLSLSRLSDVMRNHAQICQNEMKRELGNMTASDLQTMLTKTADRFDAAQEEYWVYSVARPTSDMGAVATASNDDVYDQEDTSETPQTREHQTAQTDYDLDGFNAA